MPFMEKQITSNRAWIKVETSHGTEFVDAVSPSLYVRDSQTQTHPLTAKEREEIISKLSPYCEGAIESWETVRGFGCRLSAPGYLDCTDWAVFETVDECNIYLNDLDEEEIEEGE